MSQELKDNASTTAMDSETSEMTDHVNHSIMAGLIIDDKPASAMSQPSTPPKRGTIEYIRAARKRPHKKGFESCHANGCGSCCACSALSGQCDECESQNIFNTAAQNYHVQQAAFLAADWHEIEPSELEGYPEDWEKIDAKTVPASEATDMVRFWNGSCRTENPETYDQ